MTAACLPVSKIGPIKAPVLTTSRADTTVNNTAKNKKEAVPETVPKPPTENIIQQLAEPKVTRQKPTIIEPLVPESSTIQDEVTAKVVESSPVEIKTKVQTSQLAAAITQPLPPPVVLPVFDPASVMDQRPEELSRQLGTASVIREEGYVQIWQYRIDACVADFFFYHNGKDSMQLNLTAWDARSTVIGGKLDMKACRNELTARHNKVLSN